MSCPIDIDEYKAQCRAPLFVDKWNQWFLVSTDDTEAGHVKRAMDFWFDETPGAEIHDLKIEAKRLEDLTGFDTVVRRETIPAPCRVLPTLRSGQTIGWYAKFVARGGVDSIPWGAYGGSAATGIWCPTGADVMLARVGTALVETPPDAPKGIVDKLLRDVPDVAKLDWVALGVAAVLVGGAIYLLSARKEAPSVVVLTSNGGGDSGGVESGEGDRGADDGFFKRRPRFLGH